MARIHVRRKADCLRVLGYVRVSTAEQKASGAGLEAQRASIAVECQRKGWTLTEIIEDAGYSAGDLKRPGVQRALEALKLGEADALLVAKLDRLSRSMLDFASIMASAQREGWGLIAMDCAVDTTTPAGEAMANVLATFAQFERRLIQQRTREALAVKRALGVKLGRPRGIPDPVVERIHRERSSGKTLASIASGLNADGVETAQGGARWHPSTIRSALESRQLGPEHDGR